MGRVDVLDKPFRENDLLGRDATVEVDPNYVISMMK
jgi:hypothetical protein